MESHNNLDFFFSRTRAAFLWTRILNIPFWVVFNILYIILFKELGATPLQITAIIALKPAASLLSPYWSAIVHERQDRLLSNLIWANIIKFIPFLFFPFIENTWLLILAFGHYMVFVRGSVPAWMEIIKQNIQGSQRERVFAFGSAIDYLGSAIVPLAFGWILDDYPGIWRWIFSGSALLGILSTLLLFRIPISFKPAAQQYKDNESIYEHLSKPWKSSWRLLKQRPDFAKFQVGYMLGGSALMMIHSVQPAFFVDVLQLSYKEIFFALAICKGVGFAIATPAWVKIFDRMNIFRLCSIVTFVTMLFPLLLMTASLNTLWVYGAFLVYGVMQAGSELSWHMSGPVFAHRDDSSVYSTTNVLVVGLRGCIAPALGSLIFAYSGPGTVLAISAFLCLIATERMYKYSVQENVEKEREKAYLA